MGVMPKEFDLPMSAEVWAPWIAGPEDRGDRDHHNLSVLARLKRGVPLAEARAECSNVGARMAREYPLANAGRGFGVMLLPDSADDYARRFMVVVAIAVALLLMLAAANVANLQLARGAARQKEMAIRIALGAGRGRLAWQLFTEGMMLSLAGAGLGLPLALGGLAVIRASVPPLVARHIASVMLAHLDARLLAFTLAAALLTGIAFTLPAAFQVAPRRIHETLKEGGRGSSASGRGGMRAGLVVSEFAFAVVLLIGAGLMVKGFRNMATLRLGFDPGHVLALGASLPPSQYPRKVQVANFYQEALHQLGALPGIQCAAVVSDLPALADSRNSPVTITERPPDPSARPLLAEVRVISEDYFRVMAMPVVRGRAFAPQDRADALPVAMISECSARRFWPRQEPLGRRLRLDSPEFSPSWLTVVGVVRDVRHFMLDSEVRPTIYVPYRQQPLRSLHLVLRTEPRREPAAADLRAAVHNLDTTLPVYGIDRISRFFTDLAGGVGVVAGLMAAIAAVALALSAAGIYAVMAYSVVQRIREFGIRLALGAQREDIAQLVLGNSLRLLAAGLALGLPAALILGRVMSSLLSGIVAVDPLIFAGFAVALCATALLASYLPARRATKVDPIVAMRNE